MVEQGDESITAAFRVHLPGVNMQDCWEGEELIGWETSV